MDFPNAGSSMRSPRPRPGSTPVDLLAAGFTPEERSAAIGVLRRRGLIEDGVPLRPRAGSTTGSEPIEEEVTLRKLRAGEPVPESDALRQLVRRGLALIAHETERRWAPSEEGRAIVLATEAGSIGALTPSLLVSGDWTERPFRPYDVRANVAYLHGARPHPYVAWVRQFEEILIGLGFEQSEGPLVETAFWNADVLFMPQDHPARSVHDMLAVQGLTGHCRTTRSSTGSPRPTRAGRSPPGRTRWDRAGGPGTTDRSRRSRSPVRRRRPSPPATSPATRHPRSGCTASIGTSGRRPWTPRTTSSSVSAKGPGGRGDQSAASDRYVPGGRSGDRNPRAQVPTQLFPLHRTLDRRVHPPSSARLDRGVPRGNVPTRGHPSPWDHRPGGGLGHRDRPGSRWSPLGSTTSESCS